MLRQTFLTFVVIITLAVAHQGKPGLQAHITYLAGMTANVDQKIGRDAIKRYEVLRNEFDGIRAEVDRVLGPAQPASGGTSAPLQ